MDQPWIRSALGLIAAVLLWTACLALPAGAAIPDGTSHQKVDLAGITLEIFTYRPKHCAPSGLLMVFHGLHRGVEDNRDALRPVADELCMLEVVPLFDERRFPGWRYQKGGIAHQGRLQPANEWTGNLALLLIDWVRSAENQPRLPYVLIGHSAGAQFLSRFAAYIPNEARAIIVANPSTHVQPSLGIEPPFGFKGIYGPDKAEAALRNYLAQHVTMVLGEEDLGDKDRDDEPAALQQGTTRYERGMNTFHAAQAAAAAHGWPLQWRLIQLPGVGHSNRDVFKSREVKAAIRSAMSARPDNAGNPQAADSADQSQRPTSGPGPRDQTQADDSSAPTQDQPNKPSDAQPQSPPQAQPKPAPPPEKEEVKITPREAEELFHSVDEILAFDSKSTGLPIKKEVKRRLTSRDEVAAYLTKHMKDEDVKRLQRSELVLKKFGLLPRDFDLEKLLVALLREQMAGYYDPKTKTVNLLDWVPMEEQEPVMAHELTHALQDQTIGLDKWMKKGEKDLGEMKKDPTAADIENDEIDDAREAVVEGQAETVMLEYELAPVGRSIVDSPDLVESMESQMASGTDDSVVFRDAPIFLKESLTFPYSYGLKFEVKLLQKGGKEKAFAGVLANPPHTTRQIMQPETYMSGEVIDPMPVVDFKRDFKNYTKFDIGAMGEFDVAVLVEQYAGKELSKRMYPEWRGGYYYAVRPKNDAAAPLGLFYASRWSSAEKAAEFAGIYARSLGQRYKKVEVEEVGNPPSSEVAPHQERKVEILLGRHSWTTEEGTVVIEQRGDTVLVSETLDAATTETLEREMFGSEVK
jgi:hypothetical protein